MSKLLILIIFLYAVTVNCFQSNQDKRLNPNDLLVDDTIKLNDNIKSIRFDNGNYAVFLHNINDNTNTWDPFYNIFKTKYIY